MHIEEIIAKIVPIDKGCVKLAQTRFDNLIKPVGSLAKLEEMTSRYCGILGVYEKQDLDYPKRDLLVWCSIAEAEQAGKIIDAKWPVNVLAAETGGRCVALLLPRRRRRTRWRRAQLWCRSWCVRAASAFWALAVWQTCRTRWCARRWPAVFCRLRL